MDYDWSDLYYCKTLVESLRAIVDMEEELIRAVEMEYGGEVVVNPFWVICILLTWAMK